MSRRMRIFGVAVAAFCFSAAAAAGASDSQVIFPGGTPNPAGELPATKPAAAMGLTTVLAVVVLAAGGGWMLWRGRKVNLSGRDTRLLAIDETRSLGNRQYLVVASYEGKKLLLGVCPGRIDLLSALPEPKVKEDPK